MLDSGSSEGGNPQLQQALQAQKLATAGGSAHSGSGSSTHGADPFSSLGGQLPPNLGHNPGAAHGASASSNSHQAPREVGSLAEELFQRPVQDISKEVFSWVDFRWLLGGNVKLTPEEESRLNQMYQNYTQLDGEIQQEATARLRREQERRQRLAAEEEQAHQRKAAEESNDIAPPSSPSKGAPSPKAKSHAQTMENKMTQDRKNGLGSVASAG